MLKENSSGFENESGRMRNLPRQDSRTTFKKVQVGFSPREESFSFPSLSFIFFLSFKFDYLDFLSFLIFLSGWFFSLPFTLFYMSARGTAVNGCQKSPLPS